jgi:hypothetical protein
VEAERSVSGSREPVRSYFPLKDLDIVRRVGAFESVAFYATDQGVVSAEGQTEAVEFATVSDSFFSTMRGELRLGRGLDRSDDAAPSLVISERLWRRAFEPRRTSSDHGDPELFAGRRHPARRLAPAAIHHRRRGRSQLPVSGAEDRRLDAGWICANAQPAMLFVLANRAAERRCRHRSSGHRRQR